MENRAFYMDARREGRAEGISVGRAEGRVEQAKIVYMNCLQRGMTEEDARALSGYEGKSARLK